MLVSSAIKSATLLLIGDNKEATTDLADRVYFEMAFREVLLRCTPVSLIAKWDKTKTDVFRRLYGENTINPQTLDYHTPLNVSWDRSYTQLYLKMPDVTKLADTDNLPIDEPLAMAVVYYLADSLSKKKTEQYRQKANEIINIYTTTSIDLMQNTLNVLFGGVDVSNYYY